MSDFVARTRWRLLLGCAFGWLWPCAGAHAAIFVVTTTADTAGNACAGTCSLRQAMNAANLLSGADEVRFNIPGAGPHTIQPGDALPKITERLLIDGYSQPGAAPNSRVDAGNDAVLKVRLNGTTLFVCADDSEIRGLSLTQGSGSEDLVVGFPCAVAGAGRGSRIVGNWFEIAPDGTRTQGNVGILTFNTDVQIGGVFPAERNHFANNSSGIELFGGTGGATILNNVFGTSPDGSTPYGMDYGMRTGSSTGVAIGSDAAPNWIRFSLLSALDVLNTSTGITAYANHISDSGSFGIDLGDNGPTPNDVDDADNGPNELQNFPVLLGAVPTDTGIAVTGLLDVPVGTNGASYRIALYESEVCSTTGRGDGARYLGSRLVTLSDTPMSAETFAFELVTAPPVPGHAITATATNPAGSTSEFSTCYTASQPRQPFVVRSLADTGGSECGASCTLRQAINAANGQPGRDVIQFELAGAGPHTITLASTLPTITSTVLIDGYSQPGASANTRVDAGNDAVIQVRVVGFDTLFVLCADDSVIRGLSLAVPPGGGPARSAAIDVGTSCPGQGKDARIVGNFIGLSPDGSGLASDVGVVVAGTPVSIGGAEPAERNQIGNSADGVILYDAGGSEVLNNVFGLDGTQTGRPNGIALRVQSSDVTVGRDAALNRFYFNVAGILVQESGVGNALFANEISNSTSIGIDLAGGGVTPNDTNDVDAGPNDLQNFPVLDGVQATESGLSISGSLDVPADASGVMVRIAIYESVLCSASGHGDGETYLGSDLVSLSGNSTLAEKFTLTLPVPAPASGHWITATATNPRGSTSEFSACLKVPPAPANEVFSDGFEG